VYAEDFLHLGANSKLIMPLKNLKNLNVCDLRISKSVTCECSGYLKPNHLSYFKYWLIPFFVSIRTKWNFIHLFSGSKPRVEILIWTKVFLFFWFLQICCINCRYYLNSWRWQSNVEALRYKPKIAGSFLIGFFGFFIDLIPPVALWLWGGLSRYLKLTSLPNV
jgi:hypothetical protein